MQLASAIQDWTALLGPEHVICDRTQLSSAETATFSTDRTIPAILRPANKEQIQDFLKDPSNPHEDKPKNFLDRFKGD